MVTLPLPKLPAVVLARRRVGYGGCEVEIPCCRLVLRKETDLIVAHRVNVVIEAVL